MGHLKGVKKVGGGLKLVIESKKIHALSEGDSVSVNGTCLTVSKKTKNGFEADVVEETLLRTNLGKMTAGVQLNLEPSLKIGDSLDGHFVTGHVDAVGKTVKTGIVITVEFPKNLAPFIAKKGSVAVNGVSLTVMGVNKNTFSVALVPFTRANTNLGEVEAGSIVNLEVDLIARYLYNFKKR